MIIPIGILGGLPAVPMTVVAVIGNLLSLMLFVALAERFGAWWSSRRKAKTRAMAGVGAGARNGVGVGAGAEAIADAEADSASVKEDSPKMKKARALWSKFGLPGLALVHPVTVGSSHAAAAIAMTLGASKKASLLWIGGSVVVWAVAFAVLAHLGTGFIYENVASDGFLGDLLDRFRRNS